MNPCKNILFVHYFHLSISSCAVTVHNLSYISVVRVAYPKKAAGALPFQVNAITALYCAVNHHII